MAGNPTGNSRQTRISVISYFSILLWLIEGGTLSGFSPLVIGAWSSLLINTNIHKVPIYLSQHPYYWKLFPWKFGRDYLAKCLKILEGQNFLIFQTLIESAFILNKCFYIKKVAEKIGKRAKNSYLLATKSVYAHHLLKKEPGPWMPLYLFFAVH